MNSLNLARGFDRLVPIYDLAGRLAFGGALRRSASLLFDRAPCAGRALVVGAGTGAVLVDLRRAGFRGDLVALDVSPGMTRRAEARLRADCGAQADPVRFVVGAVPAGDGTGATRETLRRGPYDLVVTPFVLDVLDADSLRRASEEIARALAPGGLWLVSDFAPPRGASRRVALAGLYAFFRASCGIPARSLPQIASALAAAGLQQEERCTCARGWLFAESWRKN